MELAAASVRFGCMGAPGSPSPEAPMINRNFVVFFGCPECGACYSAIQAPRPTAKPRLFSCEDCKSVVHRWSSSYDYSGWRRYENAEPAARGDGQIHEHGALRAPATTNTTTPPEAA